MILPARRLSDNGLKAWTQAVHRGYEGMVGKDPESPLCAGAHVEVAQGQGEGLPEGRARVLSGVSEWRSLPLRPTRVHGVGEAGDRGDYLQVITASANSGEGMNRRVVERLSLVRHSFVPAPSFRLQPRS